MFAFRLALGWGLLCLGIAPALAQSVDDSESQLHPFQDASIAAFDDVWREPIELVVAEEPVISGEAVATTPVADSPRLLPTLTAPPSVKHPQLLSLKDTIRDAETGLFQWFLGMLGVVGVVALGGVYWIFHVRPALDVRHTTGRLRLSSTLALPRRPGLFLVDVEDQTVLVAMDGGGIRQVVSLGQCARMKGTGRRAAADNTQRSSSRFTSNVATASEEVAFQDVYQELRGLGGDERAVLPGARSATRPPTAAAHSHMGS